MAEVRLSAASRNEFGKGAARRLRRAAQVPAVVYGHGTDPVHIALPAHDTMKALKTANVLLELAVDGEGTVLALPKHVQRDPLRGTIEHVDLLLVNRGEKVTVDVAIHLVGEPAPGGLLTQENTTVSVEASATAIPASIELSVAGLEPGTNLTAGDLALPDGVTLVSEADMLLVHIGAQTEEIEPEEVPVETPLLEV